MEVKGTVIKLLPLQKGQGRNGEWKKQEFVIETASQYPKKVCMNLWGDKIDQFNVQEGEQITASIEIESREYNGRWYTDVRAWKIQKDSEGTPPPPPPADDFPGENASSFSGGDPDDLPF
ncbi:DUF3127 domain-containing protein [Cytophagaceae bacterium ABcell3]|nr:DUF3127 domain-containing protein [Cytophagaceae bacterium ABcell3]